MRRRPKLDANHKAIGNIAQQMGANVVSLAGEGKGIPDLLIGWRGANYLWEVKRPGVHQKKRGARQAATNEAQLQWAIRWTGQYAIVTCEQDAIDFLQRHK